MITDKNDLDKIARMYENSIDSQSMFDGNNEVWSYEDGFQNALELIVYFLTPYRLVYDDGWKIK